jgi:hypothetical protein
MTRALLVLALLAAPAWATDVFINGVQVDGLQNQTFDKVTVKFDGSGNVWIEAPGYNIKKVQVGPESGRVVREEVGMTKKYFLVTEQNVVGMTEYNIDVFINSKFVRSLKSGEEQIVTDVTKHLHPGKNTVMFAAKKAIEGKEGPRSLSKTHFFRAILGEGVMSADQVVIENPVARFERTAADQNDLVQEFNVTAR